VKNGNKRKPLSQARQHRTVHGSIQEEKSNQTRKRSKKGILVHKTTAKT